MQHWLHLLAEDMPLPTPTDPAFDPAEVTPGPIGFIVTAALMVAVGLLVHSMMTRMSRMNARYEVREELEAEQARQDAAAAAGADASDPGRDTPESSGRDNSDGEPRT